MWQPSLKQAASPQQLQLRQHVQTRNEKGPSCCHYARSQPSFMVAEKSAWLYILFHSHAWLLQLSLGCCLCTDPRPDPVDPLCSAWNNVWDKHLSGIIIKCSTMSGVKHLNNNSTIKHNSICICTFLTCSHWFSKPVSKFALEPKRRLPLLLNEGGPGLATFTHLRF